jgi:hypothetical protein
MSDYLRLTREAVSAVRIHSPTTYSWFGNPSSPLPPKVRRALASGDARDYLVYNLTSRLYHAFYINGFAVPHKRQQGPALQTGLTPFVAELSAANTGHGFWEDGWQVRAVEDGYASVFRNNLLVRAPLHNCMAESQNRIIPERIVRLKLPKEFLSMSPGFYMALSDRQLRLNDSQHLVRIYWNLRAEGAVPFIRTATTLLNEAGLPFKVKISHDPALFTRCDAAVVYVLKDNYEMAAEVLERVYGEVRGQLKPATPTYTKALAQGVGCAEDPGGGESFGQNRCHLVADAIILAHEQGKKSLNDRLQVVADRYSEEGISFAEPFLNPGSRDSYPLLVQSEFRSETQKKARVGISSSFGSASFLDTAAEVGSRLSREAIWHGDQCNWLGSDPRNTDHESNGIGMAYSALGPELYAGTSGVALFLGELYANSGVSEARRTAIGAIKQALSQVDALSLKGNLGLYTGALGVLYSAARLGAIFEQQELLDRAAELLRQCALETWAECEADILSGYAGCIVGLLTLQRMLKDESLMNLAASLGDKLLQSADDSGAGSSWRSARRNDSQNLTGLSHGAAGIGYALLELSVATDDHRYRALAERAFSYERAWFDADHGNWPDFRQDSNRRARSALPLTFATTWCHGAPGIGLTRLRAYELFRDSIYKDEADIALNTTYASLKAALYAGNINFSLCHGVAGQAEVLLYGRQILGREWAERSALAFEAAEHGIETVWPASGISTCACITRRLLRSCSRTRQTAGRP